MSGDSSQLDKPPSRTHLDCMIGAMQCYAPNPCGDKHLCIHHQIARYAERAASPSASGRGKMASGPEPRCGSACLDQEQCYEAGECLRHHLQPSLASPTTAHTEDGPLGGFATVGREAAELDLMLTEFQIEVEAAADEETPPEEQTFHAAMALDLKRNLIDRYTPSATKFKNELPENFRPTTTRPSNLVTCPGCKKLVRPDSPACEDRQPRYGNACPMWARPVDITPRAE